LERGWFGGNGVRRNNMIQPIFELGKVPFLPHCTIQKREYKKDGRWYYFIHNSYNANCSGLADEDWIVEQVEKAKKIINDRKNKLSIGYL
jgi:hypothetical protein